MDKLKMKRINIIIDSDLYDKARAMAFIKRESISEIFRKALREWMTKQADKRVEILLSEKDERRLLDILKSDEFIPTEKAKKSFGA
jgi:Arc/MetJ-type ribon-helix-helix transcriptional regulator